MNRAKAAEEEYFIQQEAEKRGEQEWAQEREKARANRVESERAAALQLRRCPKCRIVLEAQTRRGVEVEHCNSCDGVWLDAGKLERLMRPELGLVQRMLRVFQAG